jgi:hypothetical protein
LYPHDASSFGGYSVSLSLHYVAKKKVTFLYHLIEASFSTFHARSGYSKGILQTLEEHEVRMDKVRSTGQGQHNT